jgi:CCR4-NOT transcription complex subunit 3
MEKFKACEKEMKTKAFSKDGLNAAQKLDPKEREKAEMSQWLATQVEELMRQIEVAEAEIELLQGGTTRSRRSKAAGNGGGRVEELATLNERRKWHVGRLEIVLRLLENNTLQTETVSALKEHISYFVESNTGEDFEFDEGVYDELDLDAEEEAFGIAADDNGSDGEDESVVDGEWTFVVLVRPNLYGHDMMHRTTYTTTSEGSQAQNAFIRRRLSF